MENISRCNCGNSNSRDIVRKCGSCGDLNCNKCNFSKCSCGSARIAKYYKIA